LRPGTTYIELGHDLDEGILHFWRGINNFVWGIVNLRWGIVDIEKGIFVVEQSPFRSIEGPEKSAEPAKDKGFAGLGFADSDSETPSIGDRMERDLKALIAGDLAKLEEAFAAAGAPWISGRRVP
jgi:hypothetical protein